MDRRTLLRGAALGTAWAATGCWGGVRGRSLLVPPSAETPSEVAVVRTADFPSYREALRQAVTLAGGLDFIRPGQRVLLKPATNSAFAYPATTDPECVLEVATLAREQGGLVRVADRSMVGRDTNESFRRTGIADAAHQAGADLHAFDDDPPVDLVHPQAAHWARHTVRVAQSALQADHLINLCTPRTHMLGDFTMSLKNLVGLVHGPARLGMHVPVGLKERLAELSLVVRPSLVVLDGRQGFVSGGPDGGDLARPGVLVVGRDPVAVDAVGLAHLRLAGAASSISSGSIWAIPQLARAAELRVGATASREIRLVGLDAEAEARLRAQLS